MTSPQAAVVIYVNGAATQCINCNEGPLCRWI